MAALAIAHKPFHGCTSPHEHCGRKTCSACILVPFISASASLLLVCQIVVHCICICVSALCISHPCMSCTASVSLHLSSRCLALHLHSTFLISLSCTASVISAPASLRLFILPARVSCTLSYMGSPWHSIQCMCCLVSLGLVLHPGHAPDIMHCNVRQGAS